MINSHNFSIVSEARIAQVFFIVKQQFEQTKLSMVPLWIFQNKGLNETTFTVTLD